MKAHILKITTTQEEVIVTIELKKEDGTVKVLEVYMEELTTWIANGLEVSYEETEEVEEALRYMNCKYISVDTEADGSKEYDVYVHKAVVYNGEIKMDVVGEFIKSYKREKSAMKFAESFGCKVVVM